MAKRIRIDLTDTLPEKLRKQGRTVCAYVYEASGVVADGFMLRQLNTRPPLYFELDEPSLAPDLYGLITYDWAVPQSWWDEQFRRTGEAPEAVWAYRWIDLEGNEQSSWAGQPVSRATIWWKVGEMVAERVVLRLLEGGEEE